MEGIKEKYLKLTETTARKTASANQDTAKKDSNSELTLELNADKRESDGVMEKMLLSPRKRRSKMAVKSPPITRVATSQPDGEFSSSFDCSDRARSMLLRMIYTETNYFDALTSLVKVVYSPSTRYCEAHTNSPS